MSTLVFAMALGVCSAQPTRFQKGAGKQEEQAQETPQKSPSAQASKETKAKEENFFNRLAIGGNLGLSFGNVTQIMLAPQVGYRFSDKFIAGPGFIYNYLRVDRAYNSFTGRWESVDIENLVYGPSAFALYFPSEVIVLGAQFEYLNHDYLYFTPLGDVIEENRWTPVFWVQAGYMQPFGRNGFIQLGLRANLLHDDSSPYATWWAPMLGFFF